MSRSRQHLTIADKNRLRRHHREHPELTQEQLRAWAYTHFGQWVARSTVGHIVRAPEEVSANPQATRFQSGRYPDMEQELYAVLETRAKQLGVDLRRTDAGVMADAELWSTANEILKRTRGSDESVSVAWVHRFKKRHGLHRSQLKRAAALMADSETLEDISTESEILEDVQTVEEHHEQETFAAKRSAEDAELIETQLSSGKRTAHFVSSDDVLLLTQVLAVKPWEVPYVMDGWQKVAEEMRANVFFRLEKTAGACQARLNLLLSHLKAGNLTALRKSGTEDEFERKCVLLREVLAQMEPHKCTKEGKKYAIAAQMSTPVKVALGREMSELALERERMAQRRLELMERKMERELAAQKRHSEDQVSRLEKMHREQQQVQQEQHVQLLKTIQQQQMMMMELIKSLAPVQNDSQDLKHTEQI